MSNVRSTPNIIKVLKEAEWDEGGTALLVDLLGMERLKKVVEYDRPATIKELPVEQCGECKYCMEGCINTLQKLVAYNKVSEIKEVAKAIDKDPEEIRMVGWCRKKETLTYLDDFDAVYCQHFA